MQAAMEALADGIRRRIVELLAERERTAGELAAAFQISRPGVSRHLRVLREAGLVRAEPDAQRRIYRLDPQPLTELDSWLHETRAFWTQRLDALETEIARGSREPRRNQDDQ
jgi:DNA-binding transcriptional ArsR family regulator